MSKYSNALTSVVRCLYHTSTEIHNIFFFFQRYLENSTKQYLSLTLENFSFKHRNEGRQSQSQIQVLTVFQSITNLSNFCLHYFCLIYRLIPVDDFPSPLVPKIIKNTCSLCSTAALCSGAQFRWKIWWC